MNAIAQSPDAPPSRLRKRLTLFTVALTGFLIMVDVTALFVALPVIREEVGSETASIADAQWVVNAYALSFGVLLLSGGKLADVFGRRLLLLISVPLFMASSLACGLAPSLGFLIGARVVQGVAAAVIAPAGLSIISATFEPRERGSAIGIWSAVLGLGLAVGPLIGGLLTDGLSWRWVFFINIPLGAIACVVAAVWISESRDPAEDRSLDVPGILVSGVALFALTFGLLRAPELGWLDPVIVVLLAGGVVGIAAFILVERSRRLPMIDLSLFRSATFSGANVAVVALAFALFGFLFFASLFLQDVLRYSSVETGAALLPMTLTILFLAPPVGKLTDRFGPRWLLTAGLVLLGIALALVAPLGTDAGFWDFVPGLVAAGFGFSLAMTPLTAAALAGVPVQQAGVGAGVLNAMRQIGGGLGLAIMGAISAQEIASAAEEGRSPAQGFVDGFSISMWVGAGVMLLGAVVAALTVTRSAPAPEATGAAGPPASQATGSFAVSAPEAGKSPAALAQAGAGMAAISPAAFRLEVLAGPAAESEIPLEGDQLVLGRAERGPGKLGDDPELSRSHARVLRQDGRLLIEDLGSSNGTFVNGHRVTGATALSSGDSIDIGTSRLRVAQTVPETVVSARAQPTQEHAGAEAVGAGARPSLLLAVVAGPAAGARLPIPEGPPLLLGRAERGSGSLGDDTELSRRHASISVLDARRLLVEDLGSTNGTFVNDHRIGAPTVLQAGDSLSVGASVLRVETPDEGSVS